MVRERERETTLFCTQLTPVYFWEEGQIGRRQMFAEALTNILTIYVYVYVLLTCWQYITLNLLSAYALVTVLLLTFNAIKYILPSSSHSVCKM